VTLLLLLLSPNDIINSVTVTVRINKAEESTGLTLVRLTAHYSRQLY